MTRTFTGDIGEFPYGSVVTYAATRAAEDAGADLLLFTDLANPTSNSISQAMGFRPVADYTEFIFTTAAAPVCTLRPAGTGADGR